MTKDNIAISAPVIRGPVLATGLWAERQGRQIHIHISGAHGSHTTVTNDQNSERYHRTLFRDLRRVLKANECWPFGDEGAETETAAAKHN